MQMALVLKVSMFVYFISGLLPARNSCLSPSGIASAPLYVEHTAAKNFWNTGVRFSWLLQ